MILSEKLPSVQASPASATAPWPPEAQVILTALEAGGFGQGERRGILRRSFRVIAALRLYSDPPGTEPCLLYTRDVHSRGLGFICSQRLPLGHGGVVDIPMPDGQSLRVPCALLRCREAAPGWFEGSVYFNRDQPELTA